MAVKNTSELRALIRKQLASEGGKARAEKYDHATLSKWAKLGGRPRKTNAQAQQEQSSSVASLSKGRRK